MEYILGATVGVEEGVLVGPAEGSDEGVEVGRAIK